MPDRSRLTLQPASTEPVTVRTVPYVPADMPVMYADGVLVSRSPHVWSLTFTRAELPLEVDAREAPATIPARAVVRLVVANDRMDEFLRVLTEQAGAAFHPASGPMDSDA